MSRIGTTVASTDNKALNTTMSSRKPNTLMPRMRVDSQNVVMLVTLDNLRTLTRWWTSRITVCGSPRTTHNK